MGTTAASKYAQAQIKKLDIARNATTKLVLEQAEKNLRSQIEDFLAWEAAPVGSSPISRSTDRAPSSLRKYAAGMILKAARLDTGPKSQDFWTYISAVTTSLSQAWVSEWEQARPAREKAELDKARAEREHEKHEAALKPNASRISELHAIIRDAAASEKLLADVYRAFEAHGKSKNARKELGEIKAKADDAARTLGKKAPVIDIPPPSTSTAAEELATIFYRALNAMPR